MTATAVLTCDVPVFFATTEGQTHRIADRLASVLRGQGYDSRAIDVASTEAWTLDWSRVRGAFLGASLHAGRHQREARAFARANAARLNRVPSGFYSVCLSAASVHPDERQEASRLAAAFPAEHGWKPELIRAVAGRLAYTRYGLITRLMMKRVARKECAPIDTSHDHEFTDWTDVDRLARTLDVIIRDRDATARRGSEGARNRGREGYRPPTDRTVGIVPASAASS